MGSSSSPIPAGMLGDVDHLGDAVGSQDRPYRVLLRDACRQADDCISKMRSLWNMECPLWTMKRPLWNLRRSLRNMWRSLGNMECLLRNMGRSLGNMGCLLRNMGHSPWNMRCSLWNMWPSLTGSAFRFLVKKTLPPSCPPEKNLL